MQLNDIVIATSFVNSLQAATSGDLTTPAVAPTITKALGIAVSEMKLIGVTTAMEYKIGNGVYIDVISIDQSIAVQAGQTVRVRIKETNSKIASQEAVLSVALTDIKPAGAPSVMGDDTNNTITGLDNTMEFSINGGITWTTYDGVNAPDVTGNVEVQVRIKETSTQPVPEIIIINFSA